MAAAPPPGDCVRIGNASFSPAAWINASLREYLGEQCPPEPLDVRLSVLLTKLHLQAADVDTAMQETASSLVNMAPTVAADVISAQEQARGARSELSALLEQAAAVEASSASAVRHIREVVAFQDSVSAASSMLGQAVEISRALASAERSFARSDSSAAAASLSESRLKLAAPGAHVLHLLPDARARAEALAERLEEGLRPALLEAICSQQPDAVARYAATLQQLGHESAVRDCYVECAQGPLFEKWNVSSRSLGLGHLEHQRRAEVVCTGVGDFLTMMGETAHTELAWLSRAMPHAEASALVVTMLRNGLGTLQQPIEQALLSCFPTEVQADGVALGEAVLTALERVWARAVAAAELAGAALSPSATPCGGHYASSVDTSVNAAGESAESAQAVAALQQAFLSPFAPVQERAAEALAPLLVSVSASVPTTAPPDSYRTAAQLLRRIVAATDSSAAPLAEALESVLRRLLPFCGALGAEGLCAWFDAQLVHTLAGLQSSLASVAVFSAKADLAGGRASVAADADGDSDDGEEELWVATDAAKALSRQALGLLRSVHALRHQLSKMQDAAAAELARASQAQLALPLTSRRQREASKRLRDPPGIRSGLLRQGAVASATATLMREAQQVALDFLVAPIRDSISSIGTSEMRDEWRGALPSHVVSPEQAGDEEATRTALLAFSATPKVRAAGGTQALVRRAYTRARRACYAPSRPRHRRSSLISSTRPTPQWCSGSPCSRHTSQAWASTCSECICCWNRTRLARRSPTCTPSCGPAARCQRRLARRQRQRPNSSLSLNDATSCCGWRRLLRGRSYCSSRLLPPSRRSLRSAPSSWLQTSPT